MTVPAALRFTYQDYMLLPEGRQYEIIDGDLFMTPAPSTEHQRVSLKLATLLYAFVSEAGLGEVLEAPCDVVLSATDVVQPDILFVSRDRLDIIGSKHLTAAPDLVVEVLSPATEERDRTSKAKLYARTGVKELWIVSPSARTIELFANGPEGFKRFSICGASEEARSRLLPGFTVPLARVF